VCILTCYIIEKDFDTYIEVNKSIVSLLNTGRKPFTFLVRGVLRDAIRFVLVVDELYFV
jgi:hypothetical protein